MLVKINNICPWNNASNIIQGLKQQSIVVRDCFIVWNQASVLIHVQGIMGQLSNKCRVAPDRCQVEYDEISSPQVI